MATEGGTALYMAVEQALKDFQIRVTTLKSQQAETESLLTKGEEALKHLVILMAQTEKVQAQAQSDLRLLEAARQTLAKENGHFHAQVKTELQSQHQKTEKTVENIWKELASHRLELLEAIKVTEEQSRKQLLALSAKLNASLDDLLAVSVKQRTMERRQGYLYWGLVALIAILSASRFL